VFLDRGYAKMLGIQGSESEWAEPESGIGRLRAPLEAHLQLTNQCAAGCQGCYTGATPLGAPNEWGLAEWKRAVDTLADLGVFHLALGGGESATLPWLPDIVEYARERGLVPNLTTSGLAGLDNVLQIADRFGQINVSLDGLADTYKRVRGFDGFDKAVTALRALRARTKHVGINVVVTRDNFEEIEDLFRFAKKLRLNEVELLRFKPSGRGASVYSDLACSQQQHREFLPAVLAAVRKMRVRARVDCSYTPMIAHHKPSARLLETLSVYGCTGGDFLIGAKADGAVSACSFAVPPPQRPKVTDLGTYWEQPDAFPVFRNWEALPEPCNSCEYKNLCRGGCRVVSRHVCRDPQAPDPECPRVVDHAETTRHESASGKRLRVLQPESPAC